MLYDYIQYLPDDIIAIIWKHLSKFNKIFLNKNNYIKYNHLIDILIINGRYESYVRNIIRNDYSFVFDQIFKRKYKYWLQIKKYQYTDTIYKNYILFLLYYSNINNSQKCYDIINLQLNLMGFKKDWCKNTRIKNNKWIH